MRGIACTFVCDCVVVFWFAGVLQRPVQVPDPCGTRRNGKGRHSAILLAETPCSRGKCMRPQLATARIIPGFLFHELKAVTGLFVTVLCVRMAASCVCSPPPTVRGAGPSYQNPATVQVHSSIQCGHLQAGHSHLLQ